MTMEVELTPRCLPVLCRPMKATISGNPGKSLMKIIVDADTDRVLGMHMVGADGPEIMQVRHVTTWTLDLPDLVTDNS